MTVLRIQPDHKSRLIALALVELAIDGVVLVIHGLQVLTLRHPDSDDPATGVDLPRYHTADGRWQPALDLPEELRARSAMPCWRAAASSGSPTGSG